jgi:translation initiation factor IF-3
MEVVGKIKAIDTTKEVGTGGFKKRDVVVTTDEKYPQDIQIQFVQDKVDLLDKFKIGESVKIGINLRGREWTNAKGEIVYFNTIQAWNINKVESVDTNDLPAAEKVFEGATVAVGSQEEQDDLPF